MYTMGYVPARINYSKCENGRPVFVPLIKPDINNVKAMKCAQKVRNAFGIARGRYRKKVNIVTVDINAYGKASGGAPPRNF